MNCGKQLGNHQYKYCSHRCRSEHLREKRINDWLNGEWNGSQPKTGELSTTIRQYLLNTCDYKCQKCHWGETNLASGIVPLPVHHKNGDPTDNHPSNIEILCPNCHSLTDTYGGANRGNGRWYRYT